MAKRRGHSGLVSSRLCSLSCASASCSSSCNLPIAISGRKTRGREEEATCQDKQREEEGNCGRGAGAAGRWRRGWVTRAPTPITSPSHVMRVCDATPTHIPHEQRDSCICPYAQMPAHVTHGTYLLRSEVNVPRRTATLFSKGSASARVTKGGVLVDDRLRMLGARIARQAARRCTYQGKRLSVPFGAWVDAKSATPGQGLMALETLCACATHRKSCCQLARAQPPRVHHTRRHSHGACRLEVLGRTDELAERALVRRPSHRGHGSDNHVYLHKSREAVSRTAHCR